MLANNIANQTKLEKEFLSGILGVLEHVQSLNAIIDNAKQQSLPLSMIFIDFQDAFGSVPHKLISDMLHHIQVSDQIQAYVSDMYSN